MKLNHPVSVCALLVAVVLSGCGGHETGSAGPERPEVGVVQPITRSVTEYAYFTGQIQAVDSVDLRARVTGYLQKICYTPGAIVKKGTVLFEIDPSPYKAQVDTAKGKLAEAKSQVAEAKAKVAQAEAQVNVDRVRMAIDKEVAKTSGAISKLKLEEDDAKVKESEASLEQCKASVTALEASVEAATANLEYNQLHLDWTKVTSPIDGRVDRNLLTVGNLVTADVTTLTNIVNSDQVYVYFDVDELNCLDIQKDIREGGYAQSKNVPIAVALQNEQGYPHKGTVDVVANRLNESTGTVKVRGILNNPKWMLSAGNFVRVRVAVDKPRDHLLVPDRSVIPEQGESFLLVVGDGGKIEKRRVKIGSLDPDDKSLRIIDEGLKPGEWVVVEGRQRVRPGVPVEAKHLPPLQDTPSPQPRKTIAHRSTIKMAADGQKKGVFSSIDCQKRNVVPSFSRAPEESGCLRPPRNIALLTSDDSKNP
jgi:membrane fusion protein, multidrug efflux system